MAGGVTWRGLPIGRHEHVNAGYQNVIPHSHNSRPLLYRPSRCARREGEAVVTTLQRRARTHVPFYQRVCCQWRVCLRGSFGLDEPRKPCQASRRLYSKYR